MEIDRLICPEYSTALAIARTLRNPGALAIESFARGRVEMQEFTTSGGGSAIGKRLMDVRLPAGSRLALIRRGGDAFIPEPAGNVLAHIDIEDDGVTVRGAQVRTPDPDWGERAFLASTDERFRPVDCAVGPDGALYVVDLYRGILQHRQFVTTYLRKQVLERGLDRPVGLGRIWRIVAEDFRSTGRNCPFDGWSVRGRAIATVVSGELRWALRQGRMAVGRGGGSVDVGAAIRRAHDPRRLPKPPRRLPRNRRRDVPSVDPSTPLT